MSNQWVQKCKRILDQMKKIENVKGRDRLDMVRTIRFTLFALQRSLSGWVEWVNDPDVMASFSLEGLTEISRNLSKLTQPFIEYDCEITSKAQKDLAIREPKQVKRPTDKTEISYID